jgi:N-acetylglucosaminyldiphosphoundecaprenol N-acetyl-beta-D-mannosaminyltransferase
MGLPIDPVAEAEAITAIGRALANRRGGWVITPNLDQLRQFNRDPTLRPMFETADLVVADGLPLVWASRLQATPLPERVSGSDLIWSLSAAAADWGSSVFFLGGNPGAAEGAAHRLRERNPELRIAGTLSPPLGFERSSKEIERVSEALMNAQPDIVFVGLGFPKQERLIGRLRADNPTSWFLGIGISLSFVAGEVGRAPAWTHRVGLEWVHRLLQEPRRLFRRYLVDGIPFAAHLFRHALGARLRGGSAPGRSHRP